MASCNWRQAKEASDSDTESDIEGKILDFSKWFSFI